MTCSHCTAYMTHWLTTCSHCCAGSVTQKTLSVPSSPCRTHWSDLCWISVKLIAFSASFVTKSVTGVCLVYVFINWFSHLSIFLLWVLETLIIIARLWHVAFSPHYTCLDVEWWQWCNYLLPQIESTLFKNCFINRLCFLYLVFYVFYSLCSLCFYLCTYCIRRAFVFVNVLL